MTSDYRNSQKTKFLVHTFSTLICFKSCNILLFASFCVCFMRLKDIYINLSIIELDCVVFNYYHKSWKMLVRTTQDTLVPIHFGKYVHHSSVAVWYCIELTNGRLWIFDILIVTTDKRNWHKNKFNYTHILYTCIKLYSFLPYASFSTCLK